MHYVIENNTASEEIESKKYNMPELGFKQLEATLSGWIPEVEYIDDNT